MVVIKGFGPHIRFKTTQPDPASVVRIVTAAEVRTIPLTRADTDLTFDSAAA